MFSYCSSGPSFDASIANQVKLDLDFKIETVKLNINYADKEDADKDIAGINFHIDDIASKIKICRWDLTVEATVGRLVLCEMSQGPDGGALEILSTPKDSHMLRVNYRQVRLIYFKKTESRIKNVCLSSQK